MEFGLSFIYCDLLNSTLTVTFEALYVMATEELLICIL